jgi:hypothetical protein
MNKNDNKAPIASLKSNWAGQKSPIFQGCDRPKRRTGETGFLSRDSNFARTVNVGDKKKNPLIEKAKEAARERRAASLKARQRYALTAKGYKRDGETFVKGFHKVPAMS